MEFTTTPQKLNEMIEYGTQFIKEEKVNFDDYLDEMTQKFFPEAYIDVIKKMHHWSMYPSANLISLDDLKKIEIDIREKELKKRVGCSIVGQAEFDSYTRVNALINRSNGFGYRDQQTRFEGFSSPHHCLNGCWDTFIHIIMKTGGGFNNLEVNAFMYAENVSSHGRFTNLIQSIFSNQHLRQKSEAYFKLQIKNLQQDIESMKMPKQRFIELSKQIQSLTTELDDVKTSNLDNLKINDIKSLKRDIESMKMPKQRFKELQQQVQSLATDLDNLKTEKNNEIKDLHDKIEELTSKASTAQQHDYVKRVETIPIYDYELIKARRRLLHLEFKRTFKFFNRLVRLRYETPMAVLVLK